MFFDTSRPFDLEAYLASRSLRIPHISFPDYAVSKRASLMSIDEDSKKVDDDGGRRDSILIAARLQVGRMTVAESRRAREQPARLRSFVSRPSGGVVLVDGDHRHDEVVIGYDGTVQDLITRMDTVIPPNNFAEVIPGLYRCAFPEPENFGFLKTLGLKSILTLVPEKYPEPNVKFMKDNGIQHFQIGIPANKDAMAIVPPCIMTMALGVVLDRRNHPLLVHCNKGKHRTGCTIGCFRKVQNWDLSSIFQEYRNHSAPKSRLLDERFIELFDERTVLWLARDNGMIENQAPIDAICTAPATALRAS